MNASDYITPILEALYEQTKIIRDQATEPAKILAAAEVQTMLSQQITKHLAKKAKALKPTAA